MQAEKVLVFIWITAGGSMDGRVEMLMKRVEGGGRESRGFYEV